jgi:hypothetical protein
MAVVGDIRKKFPSVMRFTLWSFGGLGQGRNPAQACTPPRLNLAHAADATIGRQALFQDAGSTAAS